MSIHFTSFLNILTLFKVFNLLGKQLYNLTPMFVTLLWYWEVLQLNL
jgi:hypothetical protein